MGEGLELNDVERAIAVALSRASGLPSEKTTTGAVARVLPLNQQDAPPPMPYITFKVPPMAPNGPAEIRKHYDGKRPPGQELRVTAIIRGEFTCSISAYSLGTHGSKDFKGDPTAQAIINDIAKKFRLPSYARELQCSGLVIIDILRPTDFSARLGPAGQGRCSVDIRFRCTDQVSEFEGYVETVEFDVTAS